MKFGLRACILSALARSCNVQMACIDLDRSQHDTHSVRVTSQSLISRYRVASMQGENIVRLGRSEPKATVLAGHTALSALRLHTVSAHSHCRRPA